MEENYLVGNKRRELREEKGKLEGFSLRLAELERQAQEAKLLTNEGRQYDPVDECINNGFGNYETATVAEDHEMVIDLDNNTTEKKSRRRVSNNSTGEY